MDLVIDGRTMAVRTPSGVPVTDISLVLGDTVPMRIRVDHALTDCTPALAVKRTIGSPDLVMTVTGWTREDDWQTASWVINTVPLQEALGNADSVALVAELVLVSPDGAQHTSRPIRVTVRRDILPAEFAPPAEVLANWEEMVAASLAAQLPDALDGALQEMGMHVDPVTGSSILSTGPADTPTIISCYAITWGDELLAGHLTDRCRVRKVTMTYYTDTGSTDPHWLRLWRLDGTRYVVAGVAPAVPIPASGEEITWEFTPGVALSRGDKIMLEMCVGVSTNNLNTQGLGMHAVMTPAKEDRGITYQVAYPPDITQATIAPMMRVVVDYDDGVMVGGVELTTVTQMQVLGNDIRTASANAQAAATAATTARSQAQTAATNAASSATAAQQAASAIQISYANMTQSPPDGARDNYYAYGWIMVTASSGRLNTITLQPRSAGPVTDTWPTWLKVWAEVNNKWQLLGTSTNAVAQTAATPSVWQFDGVTLDAGQRIRIDAHKTADGTAYDTRLAVRVVANTQANTGITNNQGAVSAANWMPLYTLALTTATGVTAHDIHLADQADLDAHTQDDERHVTAEDRQRWDASGGMYYADMEITADNSINGLLIPSDAPSGWYEVRVALNFTSADGRPVSVYTYSGTSDPVYDWDGYMTTKYAPWYKATPIPQHATREPSGLELRYDWWDASASLSDMGCILYICHKQGTASSICGVSGAPDGIANLGRIVVRQLTTQ